MMRILFSILLVILLAACAAFPGAAEQSNPSITYRYDGQDTTRAKQQADSYCAGFGKNARLINTGRGDGDHIATFECH